MTKDEIRLFHKNFDYMWEKLSTSYYQVKKKLGKSNRVIGDSILPAYSICAKCNNDQKYEPSMNAVNSIVQFYNLNLSPDVNTYQFLHEDLSLTDSSRYRNSTIFDRRFIGTFYGYYPSVSTKDAIVGSYLKIYEQDSLLKAVLVSGIRSDSELFSSALQSLFAEEPPRYNHFRDYYNSRTPENQRCYFYEGNVEITNSSILIKLHGADEDARKLVLTLNLDCFPIGIRRYYMGGLAFILATSDGPFDAKFYKMGLINTECGFVPMNTGGLSDLLRLPSAPYSLTLTSAEDRSWYEFILSNLGKGKTD